MNLFDWPPPFTLQPSLRARTVRLQICVRRGLRLIVPVGFNPNKAAEVLQKHRAWIERTWSRVQPKLLTAESESLPERFHLRALDQTWKVVYQIKENGGNIRHKACDSQQLLTLTGDIQNHEKVKQILRKWLHTQAEQYLFPWLEGLSAETGLRFNQVRVRNTRTRWGSCSPEKNISLSSRLLFLSPLLVEHVLLHELCHTVHLHHAKSFWNLLTRFSPDTERFRKELRQAAREVPAWLGI